MYLTGKPLGLEPLPDANPCSTQGAVPALGTSDWSTWGVGPRNSRFQPQSGLSAADIPHLKLKWAFAYPDGTASAAPIAVDGRLFLTTGKRSFCTRREDRMYLLAQRRGAGSQDGDRVRDVIW